MLELWGETKGRPQKGSNEWIHSGDNGRGHRWPQSPCCWQMYSKARITRKKSFLLITSKNIFLKCTKVLTITASPWIVWIWTSNLNPLQAFTSMTFTTWKVSQRSKQEFSHTAGKPKRCQTWYFSTPFYFLLASSGPYGPFLAIQRAFYYNKMLKCAPANVLLANVLSTNVSALWMRRNNSVEKSTRRLN